MSRRRVRVFGVCIRWFLPVLAVGSLGALIPNAAPAAISATGDVEPRINPSTWTTSTSGIVGNRAYGALAVNSGSNLNSAGVNIGNNTGGTGVVTVDGAGSTWTNSGDLVVGNSGNGTLNITNGGTVSNNNLGYIASSPGSTGAVRSPVRARCGPAITCPWKIRRS